MTRIWKTAILLGMLLIIGTLTTMPLSAQTSTSAQSATWVGVFYSSTTPGQGSSATATYTGLNQSWASTPTDASGNALTAIPADGWSARFSTTVTLTSGFWEFQALADDGVRVLVNGSAVIDAFGATGTNTHNNVTNLTGGTYNILVELVDISGTAVIQLNWFASTGTPAAQATVAPSTVANVVTVRGLAVRSGPFLGASLVAVARPGTQYPVLARNTQEGLFTWYRIQYDLDTVGWVSGRYLSFPLGDPTAVPLENTTVYDEVPDPPGRVIGVTRSVMHFRVHPSTRVARVAGVPDLFWGAQFEIISRTVQGGQNFWYQVKYTPENSTTTYVGWVYAPFIGIVGGSDPLDTVPIR